MDLYNLVVSAKISKGGGGGDIDVDALTVTENGVYSASSGHAYSPVTVSVPQSGITPAGTSNITSNGIYDVTNFASASVNVPGIVPSGTSSITANGIYDITSFASVDVNVSGGGGDTSAEDRIIDKRISGAYTNSRVTSIGFNVFYSCTSLTAVNFANVTSIGSTAFQSCTSLTTASFPNARSIGSTAFANCSALTIASFPNVTSIGSFAFGNCSALTIASFPNATAIWHSAFYSCTALTTASFPNATAIRSNVFNGCSVLMSAYFLASSVTSLSHANAFAGTPMSNSTYTGSFGSIYVPASLVDSYKTANNWSVYKDRITSYVE